MKILSYLKLPILSIYVCFLLIIMPAMQASLVSAADNNPPVFNQAYPNNTVTVVEGDLVSFTVSAYDADGDSLSYSMTNGPVGSSFNNQRFSWTASTPGHAWATFEVTDNNGGTDTLNVHIIVNASLNNAPVASDKYITVTKNIAENIYLTCSDPDGDSFTYALISGPSQGTLSSTTDGDNTFNYDPDTNYVGSDTFEYSCTDSNGASGNIATVYITVEDPAPDSCSASCQDLVSRDGSCSAAGIIPGNWIFNSEGDAFCGANYDCYCQGPSVTAIRSEDTYYVSGETGTLTYSGLISGWYIQKDADYYSTGISELTQITTSSDEYPVTIDTVPFIEDSECTDSFWGAKVGCDPNNELSTRVRYQYYLCSDTLGCANTYFKTETLDINFKETNVAPVAENDYVTTEEDTFVYIYPLRNDHDANTNDTLSYDSHTQASHGSIAWGSDSNGEFIFKYTPHINFVGNDQFTYTIKDEEGATDTATVYVTVTPVNDAPVLATIQNYTINENELLTFVVSATDVDDSSVVLTITNPPAGSSFSTLSATSARFTWTPNYAQSGTYYVTFRASDDDAASDSQTIIIQVLDTNTAPTAYNISINTDEDVSINIPLNCTDAEGDPLTYFANQGAHGSVVVSSSTATYTPGANETTADTFNYRCYDGSAYGNWATVTVTINALNDAPTISVSDQNVTEDSGMNQDLVNLDAFSNDVDGDTLIFNITSQTNSSLVFCSIDGSNNLDCNVVAPNASGYSDITIEVNDNNGGIASDTFRLIVTPVNDAPVATSFIVSTNEDVPINITLSCTDIDDLNSVLIYTHNNDVQNGTLSTIFSQNQVTYNPNFNFNGINSFTYYCEDDDNTPSNVATVTIIVNATNDAPVLSSIGDQFVNETQNLNFIVTATDVDNDPLTCNAVPVPGPMPAGATFNSTTQTFDWTPSYDQAGSYQINFSVTDGSATAWELITITVGNVNRAPIAYNQNLTTPEETTLTIILNCTEPDGDLLTYYNNNNTLNGILTGTGQIINYTPNIDFNGVDSFTYYCEDNFSATSNVATVTINVTYLNDDPVAQNLVYNTSEDVPVNISLICSDVDDIAFTYFHNDDAQNGTLSAIFNNNLTTYTPNLNFNGVDSFTYYCEDDELGRSNNATITINVSPDNDAPIIILPNVNITEDTGVNQIFADLANYTTDVDNNPITLNYTIIAQTNTSIAICSIDSLTRELNCTTQPNATGITLVTVMVDDGELNSNDSFLLTVENVNDAPVLTGFPDINVTQGFNNNTINLSDYVFDVDQDSLTFTIINQTNTTFGTCSINPNAYPINMLDCNISAARGYSDITIQVSDGEYNLTDTLRVQIYENNTPTITIISPRNQTYTTQNITINLTATDDTEVTTILYSVDGGANQTYAGVTSQILTDNTTHTLIAYAVDVFNNVANDQVTFTIDSSYIDNELPTITIISPINGHQYNYTNLPINITANDNNIVDHITWQIIDVNDSVLYTETVNAEDIVTTYDFSLNGTYRVYATAYDPAGNQASDVSIFIIDTTGNNETINDSENPTITIQSPINNWQYNYTTIPISITATDNVGVHHITWYVVDTNNVTIDSDTVLNHTVIDTLNLPANGTYRIFATAYDELFNSQTDNAIFRINTSGNNESINDTLPPVLTIHSPLNLWQYNYTNVPVILSATDDVAVRNITWYVLNSTGAQVNSGYSLTNTVVELTNFNRNDTYQIYATASDAAGNGDTRTHVFVINTSGNNESINDTTNPIIIINSPFNNYLYNYTTLPINITTSDDYGVTRIDWRLLNSTNDIIRSETTTNNFVDLTNTFSYNDTYRIIATAFDAAGNNDSAIHLFVINTSASNSTNITDVTQPNITIVSPINNWQYNYTNLPISITTSDDVGVTSINYYALNSTGDLLFNNTILANNVVSSFNFQYNGTYRLFATALDAAGNTGNTNAIFVINTSGNNQSINDTIAPIINIFSPLNNWLYNYTTIPINISASDNVAIQNISWRIINSTNDQLASGSSLTNNVIDSHTFTNGTYRIFADAFDAAGNNAQAVHLFVINTSASNSTNITDTASPNITINSPFNNYLYNYTSLSIDITTSDDVGVTSINWYVLNSTNDVIYNQTDLANFVDTYRAFINGTYRIFATAFDAAGNVGNANVLFVINTSASNSTNITDSTSPNVTIINPQSIIYNITTLPITITTSDDIGVTNINWYILNSTNNVIRNETTLNNFVLDTNTFTKNDTYRLYAFASDAAGNVGNANVLFVINTSANMTVINDTTAPNITIINPLNNYLYNYSTLPINITSSDDFGVVSINYYVLNSTNDLIINNTVPNNVVNTVHTFTSNGTYRIFATAFDAAGNNAQAVHLFVINTSASNSTNITDTISPNITIVSPQNMIYNYTNLPISITTSDDVGVTSINWYVLNSTNDVIYNQTDLANFVDTYRIFINGTYILYATAYDAAGNVGNANVLFVINTSANNNTIINDTIAPNITINDPQNMIYNYTNLPINITSSDDFGVVSINYYVLNETNQVVLNNTVNANAVFSSNDFLYNGTYRMYATAFDAAGNYDVANVLFIINTSANNNTIINDTASPNITINNPMNMIYNYTNIIINITSSDDFGVVTMNYYVLNSTNDLIFNVTRSADYILESQNFGRNDTYRIYATAFDAAGNIGTDSVLFIVNTSAAGNTTINDTVVPNITINSPMNMWQYNYTTIPINITATDDYGVVRIDWYIMNSTDDIIRSSTTSLDYVIDSQIFTSNGTYRIFATAYDGANNYANASNIFVINTTGTNSTINDTTAPLLNIIEPQDGFIYNYTDLNLNIVASDPFLNRVWYDWHYENGTIVSNVTYNVVSPLAHNYNGTYHVVAHANDYGGNYINATSYYYINTSSNSNNETYNVTPVLFIDTPVDGFVYNETNLSIQITYNHVFPLTVYYNITRWPGDISELSSINYSGVTSWNHTQDNTTYIIRAYAFDNYNNSNFDIHYYYINTTSYINNETYNVSPQIFIQSPGDGFVYNETNLSIYITYAHVFPVDISYNIAPWNEPNELNDTYYDPTLLTYYNHSRDNATYVISAFGEDPYNNTGFADNYYYINTNGNDNNETYNVSPVLIIHSPINGYIYNITNISVNITSNHPFPLTILYNISNGAGDNITNELYDIGDYYVHSMNGTYDITAYGYDDYGNIGDPYNRYFINTSTNETGLYNQTPTLEIISPANWFIYNETNLTIEIYTNHSLDLNVLYNITTLDGTPILTNVPYINVTSYNHLANGTYNITATAWDFLLNRNTVTNLYYINTTSAINNETYNVTPTLYIDSPVDGYVYNETNLTIDIYYNHPFPLDVTYDIQMWPSSAIELGTTSYTGITSWNHSADNTTYIISASAIDAEGLNNSAQNYYYINTTSIINNETYNVTPILLIEEPETGNLYNMTNLSIIITSTHPFPLTILYNVTNMNDISDNATNELYYAGDYYNHANNATYELSVYGYDDYNNNGTAISYYVINTTALQNNVTFNETPDLEIISPENWFVYNVSSIPIIINSDHELPYTVYYDIDYLDGTNLVSGIYNGSFNYPHTNGTFNITATAIDNINPENNISLSNLYYVNTSHYQNNTNYTLAPVLTIVEPQDGFVYNYSTLDVNITYVHPFPVVVNWSIVEDNYTELYDVGDSYVHTANGTYEIFAYGVDAEGLNNNAIANYIVNTSYNMSGNFTELPEVTINIPADGYVYNVTLLPVDVTINHELPYTAYYNITELDGTPIVNTTQLNITSFDHVNNGTYVMTVFATDINNNTGRDVNTYYINTSYSQNNTNYTEAPVIIIDAPADGFVYNDTNLSIQITVLHPFNTVITYDIQMWPSGATELGTTSYVPGTYYNHTFDNTTYVINAYAIDNYNNNDSAQNYYYINTTSIVNNETYNVTPVLTIVEPQDGFVYNYSTLDVNITYVHPFPVVVNWSIVEDNYTELYDVGDSYVHTANGTYVIYAEGEDNYDNYDDVSNTYVVNTSSNFTGPVTQQPVITINSPKDGYVYNESNILIDLVYSHPFDITLIYNITDSSNNSLVTNAIYNGTLTVSHSNETYLIEVYGYDAFNNSNTAHAYYYVNTSYNDNNVSYNESPVVIIDMPEDLYLYNISTLPIQITVLHPFLTTTNWNIVDYFTSAPVTSGTSLSTSYTHIANSTYVITAISTDDYSNSGNDSNTYHINTTSNINDTIDTFNPELNIISPADQFIYNTTSIPLVIAAYDPLLDTVEYNVTLLDGTPVVNTTTYVGGTIDHNMNGTYIVTAIATDLNNNVNITSNTYVINTSSNFNNQTYNVAPVINIISPANWYVYNVTTLPVEVEVNHPFDVTTKYNITTLDGTPVINDTNYTGLDSETLGEGTFIITAYTIDNFGLNNSVSNMFYINMSSSENNTEYIVDPIMIINNPENWYVYNVSGLPIELSVNHPFPTNVTWNITEFDGTPVTNGTTLSDYYFHTNGTFIITAYAQDARGYNDSTFNTYYVNTSLGFNNTEYNLDPVVTVVAPADGYVYNYTNLSVLINVFHPFGVTANYTITQLDGTPETSGNYDGAFYYDHTFDNTTYIITGYAEDVRGYNSSDINYYYISTSSNVSDTNYTETPVIVINNPQDTYVYNETNLSIDLSYVHPFPVELVYNITYGTNLELGNTNYVAGDYHNHSMDNMTYTISVYGEDNYTNSNMETAEYYISTSSNHSGVYDQAPIIYINMPVDGYIYNQLNLPINITYVHPFTVNLTYEIETWPAGTSELGTTNYNGITNYTHSTDNMTYLISAYGVDELGNNNSVQSYYYINTSSSYNNTEYNETPVIIINSPSEGYVYNVTDIMLNVTVIHPFPVIISYNTTNDLGVVNPTVVIDNYDYISHPGNDTYTTSISVVDNNGNNNYATATYYLNTSYNNNDVPYTEAPIINIVAPNDGFIFNVTNIPIYVITNHPFDLVLSWNITEINETTQAIIGTELTTQTTTNNSIVSSHDHSNNYSTYRLMVYGIDNYNNNETINSTYYISILSPVNNETYNGSNSIINSTINAILYGYDSVEVRDYYAEPNLRYISYSNVTNATIGGLNIVKNVDLSYSIVDGDSDIQMSFVDNSNISNATVYDSDLIASDVENMVITESNFSAVTFNTNDSIATGSNISLSTITADCTIINSTIINTTIIARQTCYIKNKTFVDSTVNVNNLYVTDGDPINTTITGDYIEIASNVFNSVLHNLTINGSFVNFTTAQNSSIINSNSTHAILEESDIDNSSIDSSELYNTTLVDSELYGSILYNLNVSNATLYGVFTDTSVINNSNVTNSTILNSTIIDKYIFNGTVNNGVVYANTTIGDWDGNVSTWRVILNTTNESYDIGYFTDNDGDGYVSFYWYYNNSGSWLTSTQFANDCDDNDPAIRPGVVDIYDNGIDENCDRADAHYVPPSSGGGGGGGGARLFYTSDNETNESDFREEFIFGEQPRIENLTEEVEDNETLTVVEEVDDSNSLTGAATGTDKDTSWWWLWLLLLIIVLLLLWFIWKRRKDKKEAERKVAASKKSSKKSRKKPIRKKVKPVVIPNKPEVIVEDPVVEFDHPYKGDDWD